MKKLMVLIALMGVSTLLGQIPMRRPTGFRMPGMYCTRLWRLRTKGFRKRFWNTRSASRLFRTW